MKYIEGAANCKGISGALTFWGNRAVRGRMGAGKEDKRGENKPPPSGFSGTEGARVAMSAEPELPDQALQVVGQACQVARRGGAGVGAP